MVVPLRPVGNDTVLLVLHAHLPWVKGTHAERWLFEAVTECYLPLLEALDGVRGDALTISISPTLLAMWNDAELRTRTAAYLEQRCDDPVLPGFEAACDWHRERAVSMRRRYEAIGRDLATAFVGRAQLITSAATHGFLPLLASVPSAARAQISIGLESHQRQFGARPRAMWLPECAWSMALEPMLVEQGVDAVFLESRAVEGSAYGVHRPVITPRGITVFARDAAASEQVWSSKVGYPGDPHYADHHHRRDGRRVVSVGGEPWQPEAALARAKVHAAHFLEQRAAAAARGAQVQLAPYDAELFGHWWLEGPFFIAEVLRAGASLGTVSTALKSFATAQRWSPPFSTWGRGGDAQVWLNAKNHDLWPHLHRAAETLAQLAAEGRDDESLRRRARALLVAQGSDWPFLIDANTEAGFARARFEHFLARFHDPQPDGADDALFPWLSLHHFGAGM